MSAAAIDGISFSPESKGIAIIDAKTPIHAAIGFIAGMSGMNASSAALVLVGVEALLVMFEEEDFAAPFRLRGGQSHFNQMADIAIGMAGVYYGEKYARERNLAASNSLIAKAQQVTSAAEEASKKAADALQAEASAQVKKQGTPTQAVVPEAYHDPNNPNQGVAGVRWY